MDRRNFLSVMPGLYPATLLPYAGSQEVPVPFNIPDELEKIPNFCTHEHWGSISSLGSVPGMFNADMVAGVKPGFRTSLFHLLVDPYMSGNLRGAGKDPGTYKAKGGSPANLIELAKKAPAQAINLLADVLKENRLTGTFLTTKLGIEYLYDIKLDLNDPTLLENLNDTIAINYSQLFDWYERAMEKAGFTELIRPVHPEFYFTVENEDARHELRFTRTVMRIDPLLSFWEESERKEELFEKVGVGARDAGSWRDFLERMITIARENGCVGIKQLQAYRRHLDFENPEEKAVKFGGKLTKKEEIIFQNWVVNECCKLANELNWPHQVHVGTHNLPESNPLPLQKLARNYRKQKIVQIHCWPYQREAGFLAKMYPNVYIDTCWQVILNPEYLRESMNMWIHYLPQSKITMGNDSTSIEMAVGSSLISKTILMESLNHRLSAWYAGDKGKMDLIYDYMHNNAVDLYGYGEKIYQP